MNEKPNSALPNIIAFALVLLGLIIGFIEGISGGSTAGGIIAGLGLIPACVGAWAGIQQETQAQLAVSILMILGAVGVSGLLLGLQVVDWIR